MLPPFAKKTPLQIGFPSPLLGEKPWRLPIIAKEESLLAIWKPRGIPIKAHPWYEGIPDLENALNTQISAGKKECTEVLQLNWVKAVFGLDREFEGVAIFATKAEEAAAIRNAFGSEMWQFSFQFVSYQKKEADSKLTCDLPVAAHFNERRGFISHRHGKKASTVFRQTELVGNLAVWEAITAYPRMHQIRLHANNLGIPMLGDPLAKEEEDVFRGLLPPRYRRGPLPFPFLLTKVSGSAKESDFEISAQWSKSNAAFLRVLERNGRP